VSLGGPVPLPLPLGANPPLVLGLLFWSGCGFSTLLTFRGFWDCSLQVIFLLPCLASFRSATLLRWSSSDRMFSSSSWKSSSTVLGFFLVRCEAVGPGVRPLISALIVVAWIFSRSSAMALCLSACSCTNLMLQLLCHGTYEMLAWILSWDLPSYKLSEAAAKSTNSVLVLLKKWWRIWPVQHHLLLLNSQPIRTS
jgi:hypothetical protein